METIGPFNSLVDASLAVDPTNGNLLVVDNLQPGFEHPKSAIYEFDSTGAPLGALPGTPVDGEPSGIAVASGSGRLYVTDGNSELSNVYEYGSYTAGGGGSGLVAPPESGSSSDAASSPILVTSAAAGVAAAPSEATPRSGRLGRRTHKKRRRATRLRIGVGPALVATTP